MSPTLVVLGHFDWDTHFMQFHKGLARELSKLGVDVVWVDRRLSPRKDGFQRWIRAIGRGEVTQEEGLVRLRPWTISGLKLGERFPLPSKLTTTCIRRLLQSRGQQPDVVLAYTPVENPIVRALRPRTLMYWTGDDPTLPQEDWLVEHSDVILALSNAAFDDKAIRAPERTFRVSTGVPFDVFASAKPAELPGLRRPIFGYAGAVHPARVDVGLIDAVARANPTASIVIVGPEAPEFAALDALPSNVHRLGERPYAEVPTFIKAFDVGLVPYLLNAFNIGSDPLKVHEYMAAGIPVVATNLPAFAAYDGLISIATSQEEFVRKSCAAVATRHDEDLIAARRASAREHGLDRIADKVMQILGGITELQGD